MHTEKNVARTYKLSLVLIGRIDAQSQRLGIYPGHLVALILARGLDEVEAGRWPLSRVATAYRPVWCDEE